MYGGVNSTEESREKNERNRISTIFEIVGAGRWIGPMAAMGVEKQTINLGERNYEHYNVIC